MDTRQGRQAPTVSVVLPYTDTAGPEAVELYNHTERNVLEWQTLLLYDIMAKDPEGLWVHQKYGISVPRRNGKSELVLVRCLYGLKSGEKILYTAHRTTTAHSIWERLERLCEKAGVYISSSFKAFGKEHLYTKDAGGIDFRTRTSTGGLGEGYDLLIIDEAQEYTNDQETALKYTVSDSLNPQTILIGTPPTAISAGTVFTKYRTKVREGASYESGWAEWSVDDITPPDDVDAWYDTNPSLGTILKERTIRAEIGEDNVDFNIQRLGLWLKYNQKSAISANEWDALEVDKLPKLSGPLFVGVKYGHNGENVAMSIAVKTADGKVFTEAIDCRPIKDGDGWLLDFIRKAKVKQVAIDGASGKNLLNDSMKQARLKAAIIPTVGQFIEANTLLDQGIAAGTLVHMKQPSLKQVISNCQRRNIGANGGYGFKSQLEGADIALMDSVILANWLCVSDRGEHKQKISY